MNPSNDNRDINLDGRVFIPIENSAGGVVDDRTEFHFTQVGEQFQAVYSGGDIAQGHITGRFSHNRTAHLLYHCITKNDALKAGRAEAQFTLSDDGQISMALDWVWVSGGEGSGASKYIEVVEAAQHR